MMMQCSYCGKEKRVKPYRLKRSKKLFCSEECYWKGKSQKKLIKCSFCSKEILRRPSQAPRYKNVYCSMECRYKWQKGKKRPDVSKALLRDWYNGTREFKGTTKIDKIIRSSSLYKEWRLKIFERDNFICQDCKKSGVFLEAHHHKISFKLLLTEFLLLYDEKDDLYKQLIKFQKFWDLNNGITLCKSCHRKRHKFKPE